MTTIVVRYRYIISLAAAALLLLLAATPLADGGVSLKVFDLDALRPKTNHRLNGTIVCNLTDKVSNSYGLIGTKLPSSLTYRVNSSVPASISGDLSTITSNSFATWQAVAPGVSATRGADTTIARAALDGQNIIAWNRLSSRTLGATYIWYNPATGLVVDVDTIMNSRQPWGWTDPSSTNVDQNCPSTNAYDAGNILTHEIGHWFGLDDEYSSQEEDQTMFGYGAKQELKKDTLESGDKAGAGAIYGP